MLIVKAMTVTTALILASTSQFKTNLTLIHSIDFDSHPYQKIHRNGLSGTSYFYEENLREIDAVNLDRFLGVLRKKDWDTIYAHLSEIIDAS